MFRNFILNYRLDYLDKLIAFYKRIDVNAELRELSVVVVLLLRQKLSVIGSRRQGVMAESTCHLDQSY